MLHALLLITTMAAGVAAGKDREKIPEEIDDPATAAKSTTEGAATRSSAPSSPAATGSSPCGEGPVDVLIGYEPGMPPIQVGSGTRVARVLERAFSGPCFRLVARAYQREDLGPSLVKGLIDVGVVGIAAAESYASRDKASLGAADTDGVDTLLLHPASYSVVSRHVDQEAPPGVHGKSPWVVVPAGALLGIGALLASISVLNLKLPRLDRLFERATRRVDPQLTRFRRTLAWVCGTSSGRFFALLWAALGVVLAIQELSTEALTDESVPEPAEYLRGAQLAAYPGRDIYEYRNQRWKRCPRPFQCMRDYDRKEAQALSGDRDVLCRYARETNAAELEFRPDVAVPILYALLLPAAPRPGTERGDKAKSALLEALTVETYTGSPWRECTAPIAAAQPLP